MKINKQKFLLVIISILLLIPLFSLPASALSTTARVNSDYSAITWNGHNYIRVHGSNISYVYGEYISDLALPQSEYDHVMYVDTCANEYAIELSLEFNEGGYTTYYYIREDMLDEYNDAITNGSGELSIYYGWLGFGSGETEVVSRESLYTEPITMKGHELARYSSMVYVEQSIFDGKIELCSRGYIFKDENERFYFLDYYQFGNTFYIGTDVWQNDTVTVYEITDEKIIDALTDDVDTDTDYFDDSGTVGYFIFSDVVFALALGVLPCIIALASFIIGFFAKKGYKKFFFIISLLCILAAIATFITVLLSVLFYFI